MHIQAICKFIQGELIGSLNNTIIDTILIDSRKVVHAHTALFVCLVTDSNNGHNFIGDAYSKGVRNFLISEDIPTQPYTEACFIKVVHTLFAIQELAKSHRTKFTHPVIGITGSNGKTIVKEWLSQLLSSKYKIVKSPKSYNSQIGVALSVLEMDERYNLGIFEAGISKPLEMPRLAEMIQPTIGVFTHLGDQHGENFESDLHKLKEKAALFTNCKQVIFSTNNKEVTQLFKQILPDKLFTWGNEKTNNLVTQQIISDNTNTKLKLFYNNQKQEILIPFIDDASINNAITCIAVCLCMGLTFEVIKKEVLQLQPIAMRLELKTGINNCTIINDSYNSDIAALNIALDLLVQQKQHLKTTVILSDILGSSLADNILYEEVADLLLQKKVNSLIGIGNNLAQAQQLFINNENLKCYFYLSTEQFLDAIHLHHFSNESILIKGARKFSFELINQVLEARLHQTVLEVNLNAIVENYNTYMQLLKKDVAIMAMVKAFSYGSGSYEVANKLQFLGADYLAVAYADEGLLLRQSGITLPIMVMNPDVHAFDNMIAHNLEPEIYSEKILHKFVAACKENEVSNYPIHLKIDTGMHRLGFTLQDLTDNLNTFINNKDTITIKSIFSHLAASDDAQLDEFTSTQALHFNKAIALVNTFANYNYYKHLCNTAGIVRHPNLHYNMVRLGVGLYGVDYSGNLKNKIKHISRLKTAIAQIKYLEAGETVGYSRKGIVNRPSTIATVCIGYADGVSRALSNGKGKMYIKGKLAPIIGNVCMDMCMLDITDVPNVQEGDEVIVFGPELPITQVAEWAGTIAYEIMTDISTRVKRVYYEE